MNRRSVSQTFSEFREAYPELLAKTTAHAEDPNAIYAQTSRDTLIKLPIRPVDSRGNIQKDDFEELLHAPKTRHVGKSCKKTNDIEARKRLRSTS